MSCNSVLLQSLINEDQKVKTIVVTLSTNSFGLTEKDLIKGTGLEGQQVLSCLSKLQKLGAVEIFCTQIGTAGPYDYFFRFSSEIKVTVNVQERAQKT